MIFCDAADCGGNCSTVPLANLEVNFCYNSPVVDYRSAEAYTVGDFGLPYVVCVSGNQCGTPVDVPFVNTCVNTDPAEFHTSFGSFFFLPPDQSCTID